MKILRKMYSRVVEYKYGKMTDRSEFLGGSGEDHGNEYCCSNTLVFERGQFFKAEDLVSHLAKLQSTLDLHAKDLNERFSARLAVSFRESHEVLEADGVNDSRYCNCLKVVVKSAANGGVVSESLIGPNSYESVCAGVETCVSEFENRILATRDSTVTDSIRENIDVLLRPKAAGQFFHEAVGHLLEGDTFELAMDQLMGRVLDPKISFGDSIVDHQELVGLNLIDDECTAIQPMWFIQNGVLNDVIRTKQFNFSSAELRGFARSQSILFPPMPRMRMCVLQPVIGARLQRFSNRFFLLDNVYNGTVVPHALRYYLRGSGYLVVDDVKRAYVPNATVSGDLFMTLESIPYIGDDVSVFASDCFKNGQVVRVGYSSPSVVLLNQMVDGGKVDLVRPEVYSYG